jgi:hypothetical protein
MEKTSKRDGTVLEASKRWTETPSKRDGRVLEASQTTGGDTFQTGWPSSQSLSNDGLRHLPNVKGTVLKASHTTGGDTFQTGWHSSQGLSNDGRRHLQNGMAQFSGPLKRWVETPSKLDGTVLEASQTMGGDRFQTGWQFSTFLKRWLETHSKLDGTVLNASQTMSGYTFRRGWHSSPGFSNVGGGEIHSKRNGRALKN